MRGLPASGKSTRATQLVESKGHYKRINRDSLRTMVDCGKFTDAKEKLIRKSELALAGLYLEAGFTPIIDDCNLAPTAMSMWQEFSQAQSARVEIEDFTHVSVETCIERDRKRQNYVGEKVIRRMYRDFLQPKPPVIEDNPDLPYAIICDLDGTLALTDGRNPYDTAQCIHDGLNTPVAGIVLTCAARGDVILFTSGREDKFRTQTIWWLTDQGFAPINLQSYLYMRATGDTRKDAIVKREIYDRHIAGKFNIRFVLDDRQQVCDLWRSLGLTCLQVADGDY
jgi:predicted kinase